MQGQDFGPAEVPLGDADRPCHAFKSEYMPLTLSYTSMGSPSRIKPYVYPLADARGYSIKA